VKVGHCVKSVVLPQRGSRIGDRTERTKDKVETGGHVEVNKQSWRFEIGAPCAASVACRMCT
jgi:hypothetical protein